MIFVDGREGSAELLPRLQKAGLPAELASPQLAFGDLFFMGRGTKGVAVSIGIEHKTLSDVVNSLRTARLQGHQLPGMKAALEGQKPLYDFAYLIIEGELIYDKMGRLMRRKGKREFVPMEGGFTVDELVKRINVMHLCAGLNPVWSVDRNFTIAWITATYRCWTDTDLDKHKSHLAIYEPPTLAPISQFVRTMRTIPSVGLTVAKAAEKKFGSIRHAVLANQQVWAEIETVKDGKRRKFGMSNAMKVREAVE